jgi:5'-nucleotidase
MAKERISRRTFAKSALLGGIALGAGIPLWANEDESVSHLCILHTNDTHSRIDPYPANDPHFPLMGGYAKRASLIQSIRQSCEHVLLLDAGDIFQGTPYYNIYGGKPELVLMSQMGYDASTMGNHEFDNGLEGFLKVLPHAEFPFITSNYDFSTTPLRDKTLLYKTFQKGDIKIGIYGLGVELEGLVGKNHYGNTRYNDPVFVAHRIERLLKEEHNCDVIICLSHLGFEYESNQVSDRIIAQKTRYTNIIIGGHTHTLLDPAAIIANSTGQNVYVGQTGYGGVRLGRMDLYFNQNKKESFVEVTTTNILENQVV